MWPSVPKIIPEKQLGTAYALIFWVQNWGLMGVPYLIGWVLNKYCFIGYFAILGTGFTTNQGDNIVKLATLDQQVYELSVVGSIARKDTTMQVSQFIYDDNGTVTDVVVASGDTIQRTSISDKAFRKLEKSKEVKVPLYSFEDKGRIDHFITNKGESVTKYQNIASFYNYTIPMGIFTLLGVIALLFAFLLKAEDRKKGYGLQLPNIQK